MKRCGLSNIDMWGGVLPAVSGLEYSSLQRECTELPYAIPLLVDTAIVQKEEMLRRMYKAPGFAQGKTGDPRSIDNIFDENKKSEPVPDWE